MIIKNAKIKNVTAGTDSKRNLIVSMEFQAEFKLLSVFIVHLANPVELKNLVKLMGFVGVKEIKKLEGKIIRVAKHESCIIAIGHPIEDRFVDITNTMVDFIEELTEAALLKEYPETE